MTNSSRTYHLPKILTLEAQPFLAFDSPLNNEAQDEENVKEPTTRVTVKLEAGRIVSTLTIDLKKLTDEELDNIVEGGGSFIPGNLNFEFADQAGDVWVAQCPLWVTDFYNLAFEVPLSF